ncbi:DUF1667 domain-containing protein [Vallitalea okinawensis]|uniref:DUF1667 domain-containing protein n=1 Tax=Vallitalea okinawensis TaxID=2078660 RepID=UPI001FA88213|nr:DUF1667 domain-containing protein [Vallitalea okinawensis]
MTCIVCPKGCRIKAKQEGDELIIEGHACRRGYDYAVQELTCPKRHIQTTVQTIFSEHPRLSVKTDCPINFEKIREVMDACHHVLIKYKVRTGDIIIENVCNSGANIVATTDLYLRTNDN